MRSRAHPAASIAKSDGPNRGSTCPVRHTRASRSKGPAQAEFLHFETHRAYFSGHASPALQLMNFMGLNVGWQKSIQKHTIDINKVFGRDGGGVELGSNILSQDFARLRKSTSREVKPGVLTNYVARHGRHSDPVSDADRHPS
jgi:hypothetical protein